MHVTHRHVLAFLWRYVRTHVGVLVGMLTMLVVSTALQLLQPFFYKEALDLIVQQGIGGTQVRRAALLFVMSVLVAFARVTVREVATMMLGWVELRVMRAAHADVVAHVQRLSTQFHVNAFAGATSRRIGRGTDAMETMMDRCWFNFLPAVALTVGLAVVLTVFAPRIGAVMVAGGIVYAAAAVSLSLWLWSEGRFTPGSFLVLFSYMQMLWDHLFNIGREAREYLRASAHAQEMVGLMNTALDVADPPEAQTLRAGEGAIRFDRVCFHYGHQTRYIFENLSLSVAAGEKIALVGHSGGGKSTFVKLLLRLYDVQGGRISIDGQDIAKVTQESLRRAIALVPQDPILFHRSLRDNIAYARPDANDAAIEHAAKLAHVHEFIRTLPKGYDTLVGERGIKLSGGERQRVAIARAILANTPILVLDEATSSLDSLSEKYIQEALASLMEGRTTIAIAHRLSTIKRVDRILVIEEGRVVEEGSHTELVKKPNGLYRNFFELQAGGFIGE